MKRYFTPHTPGAVERIRQMTTSSTQIGYLDLEAFYQQAKSARAVLDNPTIGLRWLTENLADKLMCVIDAIRDDGLDPRWHREVDALESLTYDDGRRYVGRAWAEDMVKALHKRGYKIVKDET